MSAISSVPVRNIYYLLCYAWNCLEEGDPAGVQNESATSLIELLGRVLVSGTTQLLKKGLHRTYVDRVEVVAGLRGQLQINDTIRRQLHLRATTSCRFDELTRNDLGNRILKASLRMILRYPRVDQDLRSDIELVLHRLREVDDAVLRADSFRRVQLHRNNRVYGFLLQVCRFIYENTFLEADGRAHFRDFVRDRAKMAVLFQQFVFNFLDREQSTYTVSSPQLKWHESAGRVSTAAFLPNMLTDVLLTSRTPIDNRPRTVVLDTKYYADAFQHHHDSEKARSENLYQLFAYLKNVEAEQGIGRTRIDGVLLYPAIDHDFERRAMLLGHEVVVRSVDLAKPWQAIHAELLAVCH
jgi:5-methylcytosine-specific restriction enzyme subunit McrC